MSWLGKILGGTLGFALGGSIGALVGVALGHNLDRSARVSPPRAGSGRGAHRRRLSATGRPENRRGDLLCPAPRRPFVVCPCR